MPHLPLLSGAYSTALIAPNKPPPESELHDRAPEASSNSPERPSPALEDEDDDVETARTRPLRFDQIL